MVVCLLFVVVEEGVFGVVWIGWYVWCYFDVEFGMFVDEWC